jgi:hypothetical protein
MEAGSDLDPERSHTLHDRLCAPDPTQRAVERREEAVSRRVYLSPSVGGEHRADGTVMVFHQLSPAAITDLSCLLGGPDDVGEQYRGEDPVELRRAPCPGQEFLDLVWDHVGRSNEC